MINLSYSIFSNSSSESRSPTGTDSTLRNARWGAVCVAVPVGLLQKTLCCTSVANPTHFLFFFFSIISLQLSFTFQSIVLGRATTCIMLCTPDHITHPYSCLEVMCTSANRVGSHDARELLVHHYSFPQQISNLISKTTKKRRAVSYHLHANLHPFLRIRSRRLYR